MAISPSTYVFFSPVPKFALLLPPLLRARTPAYPCHQRYRLYFPSYSNSTQPTQGIQDELGSSFDLSGYWADLIYQMEAGLDAAIRRQYPERIHDAMRYSVLSPGAKRVPSFMCITVACELLGVPRDAALPTACALEMVHAASLIHDDLPCMEAAPVHRGRPTNHVVFGVGMALLAGGALLPYGVCHIVYRTPSEVVAEDRLLRVVAEIARAVGSTGMAAGQYLDLDSTITDGDAVMTVLEKKFGEMAECSAACGGLLGGADEAELDAIRRYGRVVGVLSQVVDDILMEDANCSGGEGKLRSKASLLTVYGMEKTKEVAEPRWKSKCCKPGTGWRRFYPSKAS